MSNPRTTFLRALILAAVAVPAAACGDASDDSSTSSTTPSAGGAGGGGGAGGSAAGSGGSDAGAGGSVAGSGGSDAGSGGSVAGSGGATAGAGGSAAGSGGSDAGSGGSDAGSGGAAAGAGGSAAGSGGSDAGSGGSDAGQGGGGAGGSGGAAGSSGYPCEKPESLLVGGKPTGYERCANGTIHRKENLECPSLLPQPKACEQADQGGNCKSDADCTEAPNGFCVGSQGGFQAPGCYCNYGCTKDTDCGEGSICLCGEPVGHCVSATCRSDKDCGGGLCNSYGNDELCYTFGFACQSPKDTCGGNKDCTSPEFCLVDGDHRVCKEDQPCAIGRPLVVEDGWRFAGLVRRAGGWA